jgi:hypothetical protein
VEKPGAECSVITVGPHFKLPAFLTHPITAGQFFSLIVPHLSPLTARK